MSHYYFTDQQTEEDLLSVLRQFNQESRINAGVQDQNWIDIYDDDPAKVIPAAAALCYCALRADQADPMLQDVVDAVLPCLPQPKNPTRAAFGNAFKLLAEKRLLAEYPLLYRIDMLSKDQAEIEPGLLVLARTVQDYLEPISQADYGDLANEHKRALEDMLRSDFRKFPTKQRWIPMEVLELVSHVPSDQGHVPALAIVLLEALHNDDGYGNVQFRWEHQKDEILGMPPKIRDPFLAAFKYFHELDGGACLI